MSGSGVCVFRREYAIIMLKMIQQMDSKTLAVFAVILYYLASFIRSFWVFPMCHDVFLSLSNS